MRSRPGAIALAAVVLGCPRPAAPPPLATLRAEPAPVVVPYAGLHTLLAGPHTILDRPEDNAREVRESGFLPFAVANALPRSMTNLDVLEGWELTEGGLWHVRRVRWLDPHGQAARTYPGFDAAPPDPTVCPTREGIQADAWFVRDGGAQTLCLQHEDAHMSPAVLTLRDRVPATRDDLSRQLPDLLGRHPEIARMRPAYEALAGCVDRVRIEHAVGGGAIWMRVDGTCTTEQLRALDPWCREAGLRILEGGGCTGTLPGVVEVDAERGEDGRFALFFDI